MALNLRPARSLLFATALLLPARAADALAVPIPPGDVPPVIYEGRTLVPFRPVLEWIGASFDWNNQTKTLSITRLFGTVERHVSIEAGNPLARVEGEVRTIDVPPLILDGRVMVPIRFVAESLGLQVVWQPTTRRVLLTDHGRQGYLEVPAEGRGGAVPQNSRRAAIGGVANQVITALAQRDTATLQRLVHPTRGVRFSHDVHFEESDPLFQADELDAAWTSATTYTWGHEDGTGRAITLSFREFLERYLDTRQWLEAPQIVYDETVRRGNLVNNIREFYPAAATVEYHFPAGEPGGLDWESLHLVFESYNGAWYLTGVAHAAWTI